MKTHIRSLAAVGTALALLASIAACGSDGSTASAAQSAASSTYKCDEPNATTTSTVTVASLPIVSNGAIYEGINQGFFTKHGLELQIKKVDSLAATVSAIQGGTVDVGFTGTIAYFTALQNGIKASIVSPFAGIAPKYWEKMQAGEPGYTREVTALMTMPSSGINTPGDLSGRTVAVADVKGMAELTTRYVIKAHGGDPDSVKYVVMTPPDAVNAMLAGKIDAAYSSDVNIIAGEKGGAKIISWPGVETFHEGPTSMLVASDNYITKNPDTVARFNCAIRESVEYANQHPDAIRAATAKQQGIAPSTLAKATVPYFHEYVDLDGLERFKSVMKDFKYLTKEIDLKTVVIPQALKQ